MDSESISRRKYTHTHTHTHTHSLSHCTTRVERKSYDKLYYLFIVFSFRYLWEFLHRLQAVVIEV